MKILMIEDDPILQNMYKYQFEKDGFEVTAISDAKNGVVEAVKTSPDFILLDIMMPMVEMMDGVEAFKQLKEMPETKDIPTAFLTVVPEGVSQPLKNNPELLKLAVAYWRKDQNTPPEVSENIKKILQAKS